MTEMLGATPKEWIVAFEPKTSIWWGRFLTPGFGHCFMFGWLDLGDETGIWLFQEALVSGVHMGVASPEAVERWFAEAYIGRLRLLRIKPINSIVVRPRFMVTCAGAIGAVLGLRRLPLTPHGLFWMLRRLGAREVGRNTDGRSTEAGNAAPAHGGGDRPAAGGGAGGEGRGGAGAAGEAAGGAEQHGGAGGDDGGAARPPRLALGCG